MSDLAVIAGDIEAVSVKERQTPHGLKKAYSYMINGAWYSGGFKNRGVKKGDKVQFTFREKNGFKNIETIAVTESGGIPVPTSPSIGGGSSNQRTFPVQPLAPERAINRQNALTNAVKFLENSTTADIETVILTARAFEAYTTGDIDLEEAMSLVDHE